jgi:hypothetical protein
MATGSVLTGLHRRSRGKALTPSAQSAIYRQSRRPAHGGAGARRLRSLRGAFVLRVSRDFESPGQHRTPRQLLRAEQAHAAALVPIRAHAASGFARRLRRRPRSAPVVSRRHLAVRLGITFSAPTTVIVASFVPGGIQPSATSVHARDSPGWRICLTTISLESSFTPAASR